MIYRIGGKDVGRKQYNDYIKKNIKDPSIRENALKHTGEYKMVEKVKKEKKKQETSGLKGTWGKIKCSVCGVEKMASPDRYKKIEEAGKLKTYKCRECRK